MKPLRIIFWDTDPDRVQVARARRGNRAAFDALVRVYEQPLRGFVARRVRGDAAIDDVLQETWLGAWAGVASARGPFKAWLYGVALHKCADFHRARGRGADTEIALNTDEDEARLARLYGPDAYADVDLRDGVRAALLTLPPAQRDVLDLYYYAQLTLAEIAQALGRNESAVKYQFYRAHAQLAEPMRQLLDADPLPARTSATAPSSR